jgi:hypothetical protein
MKIIEGSSTCLPIDIINKILEYNGGYIKLRDPKTLCGSRAAKRGKYIMATVSQISNTDERYAMLRRIPEKKYMLYRYKDDTIALCITRIVSQPKFICAATEPWERDSTSLNLDIRTDDQKPYVEYHCWFSKSLDSKRFLLY